MKLLKNKLTVTVIVLSVAFLGLITATATRNAKGIESIAGDTLNPIQKVAYNMNRGLKDFVDIILNFSSVRAENKALAKENQELKNKITEDADLEAENERLKSLLDLKDRNANYDYIAINIIAYAGDGVIDGYVVDKGQNDGIEKNMVVISSEGLVGQVSSVGNNWSIVQTIINENINVSVMDEKTRKNTGILQGYTNNSNEYLLKVSNLPMDSEVQEGDQIITSGLGMLYPKEIRVGEVISVEEDKVKVMKTAIVKPSVDFNKLEELCIIAPKDKTEVKYD
ncbi:MAG: rod shape-determining protein MreC [Clostridium sp.]|uniref:rod shape-determining protein MreC n=1 Tax=Clostridium sp. DSM 8431 TaxID=1761781 RepID=UPI0008EF0D97|nr:rod shape-determining protein MreC [Clostridium sp. DSM 8431]MCR4943203.1 rod shape-determining protein MreC [Clostridium sp.]SFU50329.1 rod shape-determining protein MreC [Clostridium sp. DSM 8431]